MSAVGCAGPSGRSAYFSEEMKAALAVCALLVGHSAGHEHKHTHAKALAGAAKILRELSVAENAVAVELRGHPRVLREEETLLHEAGAMARNAAQSNMRAKEVVSAARSTQKHALVGLKKSGHRSRLQASAAKIRSEVGIAERALVLELRGQPDLLRIEEGLLHRAADMAQQASDAGAHGPKLRLARAASLKDVQRVTGPVSMALAEREVAHKDWEVADEVRSVKAAAVEALGERDPEGARQVQRLLDEVKGDQLSLAHREAKMAREMRSMGGMKASPPPKKKRSTPVAAPRRPRAPPHVSDAALAEVAATEAKLARDDRSSVAVLKLTRSEAEEALDGVDPEAADKVARLLSVAERAEDNVARSEATEASQDSRLLRQLASQQHQARRSPVFLARARGAHHKVPFFRRF